MPSVSRCPARFGHGKQVFFPAPPGADFPLLRGFRDFNLSLFGNFGASTRSAGRRWLVLLLVDQLFFDIGFSVL